MTQAMHDLITHISVERSIADMTRDGIEGFEEAECGAGRKEGIITINIDQADLLADLMLEAAGIALITAANGREVTDNLTCLAEALKGKQV